MALSIELPPPLAEGLAVEAEREGVSVSEQAAFFLGLMFAMTKEGRGTSFGSVVQAYLQQNSIDADRLAETLSRLSADYIHASVSPSISIDPREESEPAPIRKNRVSAFGKYAHLKLSSEEFMREKQEEIDREDRRSW